MTSTSEVSTPRTKQRGRAGAPAPGGAGAPAGATDAPAGASLFDRYERVRRRTASLCEPLATEDYVVQSMDDVSPTKWHLAHTSWFFETFVLGPHLSGYRPSDPDYSYLFNSYYVQAGERHCRDQRGYISRPTVSQVYAFREHVDAHMRRLLTGPDRPDDDAREEIARLVEIGLHHEQQHQELLVTDIKHVLSVNPLRPAYDDRPPAGRVENEGGGATGATPNPHGGAAESEVAETGSEPGDPRWIAYEEGLVEIGHDGEGFCFDNERPRHRHFLEAFELADRLVTNGEFLEFMADGGYERPGLWLSDGWAAVQEQEWTEPFYWERRDGRWQLYTLGGMRPVRSREPLCHVSYFEADAFARWAGARLPTEQEWERAARDVPVGGNFVESGHLHPAPASPHSAPAIGADPASAGVSGSDPAPRQMFGDVWEWTRSQYSPYPGFEPLPGALGEYNGKFMCNQFVLRGGSCATPRSHIRPTYRNFFPPDATWQFTGFRLARDA